MALGWRKDYLRYKDFFLNIVRLYKKRKELAMFLELLLTLSAISLFSLLALRPTALTIIELVKDIDAKEEMITTMDEKIMNLTLAQEEYLRESNRVNLLTTAVPNSPDPEKLARQLEGVAYQNGVGLTTISVDEAALKGKEKEERKDKTVDSFPSGSLALSFSISVDGTYQTVKNFLKDLENMRRPPVIDHLVISKTKQDQNILSLTVTGRVPYVR